MKDVEPKYRYNETRRLMAKVLMGMASGISLTALLAHFVHHVEITNWLNDVPMSMASSVCFVLICAAIFLLVDIKRKPKNDD